VSRSGTPRVPAEKVAAASQLPREGSKRKRLRSRRWSGEPDPPADRGGDSGRGTPKKEHAQKEYAQKGRTTVSFIVHGGVSIFASANDYQAEEHMKYICLAYGDRSKMEALSKGEMDAIFRECQPHAEELHKSGNVILDEGLQWETTSIRPRGGKISVTDGPFVETKEQVGGVFIIEARDLNEAILVASRHPAAHVGEHLGWGIEVRPTAVFEQER